MGRRAEASHLLLQPLNEAEPSGRTDILFDVCQEQDDFQFIMHARYSHTDDALLDQLLLARPAGLQEHWQIIRKP